MSHTPGPWEVGGPYPSVSVIYCVDPGCGGPDAEPPFYEPICILGEPDAAHREQCLADASLIAAAPDLLAALEHAKKVIRQWHDMDTDGSDSLWGIYNDNSPEMKIINKAIAKAKDTNHE